MKNIKLKLLLSLFLLAINIIFLSVGQASASGSDIIINELGAFEASDYEWIEIYNKGGEPEDLTGWKFYENETNHSLNAFQGDLIIEPNEYAIIAGKADKFISKYNFSGTVIDSSWSNLNESGEPIALKDAGGNFIESFTYLSAPNYSLERANPNLTDYTSANWQEHLSGNTAGSQNSNYNSGDNPPEGENPPPPPPASPPPTPFVPAFGDMLINEFVADPADGDEWIELYNKTSQEIDIGGWWIEEGSESITTLSGKIGIEGLGRFFIIERPKGNLNNPGDIILLKNSQGLIIDQVAYGNWNDGNIEDNAPKASDPYSLARSADGANTFNNANDFKITAIITRGSPNIISEETPSESLPSGQIYSKDIIINEILPNPAGSDNESEFIELKNIGTTTLDIAAWKLSDNTTKKYTIEKEDFSSTLIASGEFFVLTRKITGLALNNTGGEAVKLYDPYNQLIEKIEYKEAAKENQSYARDEDNNFYWTTTMTEGKENILTVPNEPPKAVIDAMTEALVGEEIKFDASDSADPDNQSLIILWDFGDGQTSNLISLTHKFSQAGIYKIILTATDSQGAQDTASINLTIKNNLNKQLVVSLGDEIIINEFLPNPEGSDEKEWIELKNISNEEINLSGWQIDDSEGGSRSHTIPEGTLINPNGFLLLERQKTKIALNNTTDSVRLFNNTGDLISQIDYEGAKEGLSYALEKNGNWFWSKAHTPGQENVIAAITINELEDKSLKSGKIIETILEKVREQDLGDQVRVRGMVAVEPGTLGKTIFYLAGSGIQIYFFKKDWPSLKLGDQIELTGTLSQISGETRIKLASKDDIKFLEHGSPPEPEIIKDEEIGEELEGYLVTIQGEVIDQKGQTIYLDNGNQEIPIYIKSTTSIPKPKVNGGDLLEVTGIVSQTKSGYRILPRYPDDIKFLPTPEGQIETSAIERNNTKNEIIKYLTVTAGALIFLLTGLIIKNKEYIKGYIRRNKS
jgi:DNA/RNA endonuclease YhcR with UshA esterase domain